MNLQDLEPSRRNKVRKTEQLGRKGRQAGTGPGASLVPCTVSPRHSQEDLSCTDSQLVRFVTLQLSFSLHVNILFSTPAVFYEIA